MIRSFRPRPVTPTGRMLPRVLKTGRRLWPLLAIPFLACLVGFLTTDRPQRFVVRGATSAVLVAAGLGYYFLT